MRRLWCACALWLACPVPLPAQTINVQDDLRNWHKLGLPVVATWKDTVGLDWQVEQARKHRLIPTIRLQFANAKDEQYSCNNIYGNKMLAIQPENQKFLRENRLPLCFRIDNIATQFGVAPVYRLPLTEANRPKSALTWRYDDDLLTELVTQLLDAANAVDQNKKFAPAAVIELATTFKWKFSEVPGLAGWCDAVLLAAKSNDKVKVVAAITRYPLNLKQRVLDDTPVADTLAPVDAWAKEGGEIGRSQYLALVQSMFPEPANITIVDNNEGALESFDWYTNPAPSGKGRVLATDAELAMRSLRMRDRVRQLRAAKPDLAPDDLAVEWHENRKRQFDAWYGAFNAQLTSGWRDKVLTAAYRGMDEPLQAKPGTKTAQIGYAPGVFVDAGSQSQYLKGATTDFTSLSMAKVLNLIPAWEWRESRNADAWRELSVNIGPAAIYGAKSAGRHEIITPARYEGYAQYLLWSLHEPGVPLLLRHFEGASVQFANPMFDATQRAALAKLGADGKAVASLTVGDYLTPLMNSVDRVCADATLRRYWLQGKAVVVPGLGHPDNQTSTQGPYPDKGTVDNRWRVLDVSTNLERSDWRVINGAITTPIKVWAVATRIDNEFLLYLWTPSLLTGNVTVIVPGFGKAIVAAPSPWSYWLLKPEKAPQRIAP